ncbi:MAG: hypothetical protein H7238_12425 [Polaromonas sp.]|nr:hypothetical protein [Polaromonas sp.]
MESKRPYDGSQSPQSWTRFDHTPPQSPSSGNGAGHLPPISPLSAVSSESGLAWVRGRSNLAATAGDAGPTVAVHVPPESPGSQHTFSMDDFTLSLDELRDVPAFVDEQMQRIADNPQGFEDFLQRMGSLTPAERAALPPLATGPDARYWQQLKAIVWGGFAGYAAGFGAGNFAAKFIALADPVAGPLLGGMAFASVGGMSSTLLGEARGGARRVSHGSFSTPDGTAWSNCITAAGRVLTARAAGRPNTANQCMVEFNELVEKLEDDIAKREKAAGGKLCFSIKGHPVASAGLRAFICDEFPIWLTFSCMGMISGFAMPGIRAVFGGPDFSDKLAVQTFDFMSALVTGFAAQIETGALQNCLRAKVMHAPNPTMGLHAREVFHSETARADAEIELLKSKLDALDNARAFLVLASGTDVLPETSMNHMWDTYMASMNANTRQQDNKEAMIDALRTETGRNNLFIARFTQQHLHGLEGAGPALLNGGPLQRRTAARSIANVAALMMAIPVFLDLASQCAAYLPHDRPAFDSPEAEQAFLEAGKNALYEASMLAGWKILSCFSARFILWPPMALLMDIIAGRIERARGVADLPLQQPAPAALPTSRPVTTLPVFDDDDGDEMDEKHNGPDSPAWVTTPGSPTRLLAPDESAQQAPTRAARARQT